MLHPFVRQRPLVEQNLEGRILICDKLFQNGQHLFDNPFVRQGPVVRQYPLLTKTLNGSKSRQRDFDMYMYMYMHMYMYMYMYIYMYMYVRMWCEMFSSVCPNRFIHQQFQNFSSSRKRQQPYRLLRRPEMLWSGPPNPLWLRNDLLVWLSGGLVVCWVGGLVVWWSGNLVVWYSWHENTVAQ